MSEHIPITEAIQVLKERAGYLAGRIEAKKAVHWETKYDERERNALLKVIQIVEVVHML